MTDSYLEAIEALPPLREVLRKNNMAALKSLGQNFLLDLNLTKRIARSAGDLSDVNVIEVGPGPGGLTRAILSQKPKSLTCIEMDNRCHQVLGEVIEAADGRLNLIEGDALKVNPVDLVEGPRAIIANLPYNVATPLLIGWLKQAAEYKSFTLMFQKEVAERIVAEPGSKTYGRLAIISQWCCHAYIELTLPPQAFTPPPKIDSAVVHMIPQFAPDPKMFAALETVTGAAFGQRRKMLRASLKSLNVPVAQLLEMAEIEETKRAEQIDVDGFVRLAESYLELKD